MVYYIQLPGLVFGRILFVNLTIIFQEHVVSYVLRVALPLAGGATAHNLVMGQLNVHVQSVTMEIYVKLKTLVNCTTLVVMVIVSFWVIMQFLERLVTLNASVIEDIKEGYVTLWTSASGRT